MDLIKMIMIMVPATVLLIAIGATDPESGGIFYLVYIILLIRLIRALVIKARGGQKRAADINGEEIREPANRKISSNAAKAHTHDRLDETHFDAHETARDHYAKQIKGFIDAGLIDRKEAKLLMEKYDESAGA